MPTIRCRDKLYQIGSWTILRLPEQASAKLPTRGMTMVEGTINGAHFQAPAEPDGRAGHWIGFDAAVLRLAHSAAGDTVKLEIEPSLHWPDPHVPTDLKTALAHVPQAQDLWTRITPNARWDWIRWIRFTKNADTRTRRIEVACSKLKSGMRRPCCFNRNLCSEPEVSRNGILIDPSM